MRDPVMAADLALTAALGVLGVVGTADTSSVAVWCAESAQGDGRRGRVRVVVGSGALHEPPEAQGVAHLLEHLILRPLDLDRYNGSTDLDSTDFFADAPAPELERTALDLARAVAAPGFTPSDLERERAVVLRELDDRGGDHARRPRDPLFDDTIFDRAVGGSESSVRDLGEADVRAFYAAHYRRGNVAVVLRDAPDCAGLTARIREVLEVLPVGPGADAPRERRPTPGARTLPFGGASMFVGGFYWYDEDLASEVAMHVIGRHLQQRALDELRGRRGLTYSPSAQVRRAARGGALQLVVTSDRGSGEIADWYDETIAELRTSTTPTALTRRAFDAIGRELTVDDRRAALASIRGDPPPMEVLRGLDDAAMRERIARLLADERRFSTSGQGVGRTVGMVLFGAAMLGIFALIVRRIAQG